MKKLKLNNKDIPKVLPIVPLSDAIIFPKMILTVEVAEDISKFLDFDDNKKRIIGILMPKSEKKNDFNDIGTLVFVHDVLKIPGKDSVKMSVQGLKRFRLKSLNTKKGYLEGSVIIMLTLPVPFIFKPLVIFCHFVFLFSDNIF